jgi:hypothetical protein
MKEINKNYKNPVDDNEKLSRFLLSVIGRLTLLCLMLPTTFIIMFFSPSGFISLTGIMSEMITKNQQMQSFAYILIGGIYLSSVYEIVTYFKIFQ